MRPCQAQPSCQPASLGSRLWKPGLLYMPQDLRVLAVRKSWKGHSYCLVALYWLRKETTPHCLSWADLLPGERGWNCSPGVEASLLLKGACPKSVSSFLLWHFPPKNTKVLPQLPPSGSLWRPWQVTLSSRVRPASVPCCTHSHSMFGKPGRALWSSSLEKAIPSTPLYVLSHFPSSCPLVCPYAMLHMSWDSYIRPSPTHQSSVTPAPEHCNILTLTPAPLSSPPMPLWIPFCPTHPSITLLPRQSPKHRVSA